MFAVGGLDLLYIHSSAIARVKKFGKNVNLSQFVWSRGIFFSGFLPFLYNIGHMILAA